MAPVEFGYTDTPALDRLMVSRSLCRPSSGFETAKAKYS